MSPLEEAWSAIPDEDHVVRGAVTRAVLFVSTR
jgi:hypothetical protein